MSQGVAPLTLDGMFTYTSSVQPVACRLPIELLQQIYRILSPFDFDSARRTCRLWLIASLDKNLLTSELVAGGWEAGAEQDLLEASEYFKNKTYQSSGESVCHVECHSDHQRVSPEWILSKRLAFESRLCPEWRGIWPCSLNEEKEWCNREIDVHTIKPPNMKPPTVRCATPSLTFTVSGCGKYVLLAEDRVVFIYSLESFTSGMRPIASVLCHRQILKVSMDTSRGRYAVAVLLEGRVGICCEMNMGDREATGRRRIHPSMSLSDFRNFDVRTTHRPARDNRRNDQLDLVSSSRRSQLDLRADYYRRTHSPRRSADASFVRGSCLTLTDSNFHNGGAEFNPPAPNSSLRQFYPESCVDEHANESLLQHYPFNNFDPITGTSVSVELGARKIYKNLCSVQDPPESVAICPQRQCIAFGCKTGVELHWIDALRGSTLSRWFPLAAPSDFLYFVPPRDDEQATSNTKLRLISSAAGPEEFVDADHYRAVALSNGQILFTDPESGHLCLGSDRPGGRTKLRREVVCLPPAGHPAGKAPDCYAAGYEMRWGVRIVVAYGTTIMFYNLPPDRLDRAMSSTPVSQVVQSDFGVHDAVENGPREPLRLEGVPIHSVGEGVVHDIAVDTRLGGLKVWLFLRDEDVRIKPKKAAIRFGWLCS